MVDSSMLLGGFQPTQGIGPDLLGSQELGSQRQAAQFQRSEAIKEQQQLNSDKEAVMHYMQQPDKTLATPDDWQTMLKEMKGRVSPETYLKLGEHADNVRKSDLDFRAKTAAMTREELQLLDNQQDQALMFMGPMAEAYENALRQNPDDKEGATKAFVQARDAQLAQLKNMQLDPQHPAYSPQVIQNLQQATPEAILFQYKHGKYNREYVDDLLKQHLTAAQITEAQTRTAGTATPEVFADDKGSKVAATFMKTGPHAGSYEMEGGVYLSPQQMLDKGYEPVANKRGEKADQQVEEYFDPKTGKPMTLFHEKSGTKMVDSKGKEVDPNELGLVRGKPPASTGNPKVTMQEEKAFSNYTTMQNAENYIEDYIKKKGLKPLEFLSTVEVDDHGVVTAAGKYGIRHALNDEQQAILQAYRQYAEGAGHLKSGARINQATMKIMKELYWPLPGEGPLTIQRKLDARKNDLEAAKSLSGRALEHAEHLKKQETDAGGVKYDSPDSISKAYKSGELTYDEAAVLLKKLPKK